MTEVQQVSRKYTITATLPRRHVLPPGQWVTRPSKQNLLELLFSDNKFLRKIRFHIREEKPVLEAPVIC